MTLTAVAEKGHVAGILMSIKTRHVRSIVAGTKTHELRRRIPRVIVGMRILIYSSGEDRAVTAQADVGAVDSGTPEIIWARYQKVLGVTRSEFEDYFRGSDVAHALRLEHVAVNPRPISLAQLRDEYGLEPPQSWRYLRSDLHGLLETSTAS